jgi:hypothetical protein
MVNSWPSRGKFPERRRGLQAVNNSGTLSVALAGLCFFFMPYPGRRFACPGLLSCAPPARLLEPRPGAWVRLLEPPPRCLGAAVVPRPGACVRLLEPCPGAWVRLLVPCPGAWVRLLEPRPEGAERK